MHLRRDVILGLVLALLAVGLLVYGVGEFAPSRQPAPSTPSQRPTSAPAAPSSLAPLTLLTPPISTGPNSELISFKQALTRIQPAALAWNSAALLERCYSLPLSATFLATVWSCTYI